MACHVSASTIWVASAPDELLHREAIDATALKRLLQLEQPRLTQAGRIMTMVVDPSLMPVGVMVELVSCFEALR